MLANVSHSFGNLTNLRTQDCLRKVKSEMKPKNMFTDLYMEDVLATQQYFRHTLADSRFPGYVQYFVQDPFILLMFTYKQLDILHLQWSLRITDTLGTWLLSVVENCPLLGDWSIYLSKHPMCIILNAVLHVLKLNSYGRSHKFYYIVIRMNII